MGPISYTCLGRLHIESATLGDVRHLLAGRMGRCIFIGSQMVEVGEADLHHFEWCMQTVCRCRGVAGLLENPMRIAEVCCFLFEEGLLPLLVFFQNSPNCLFVDDGI